ncbi:outer membrane protein transport protein [Mucilaginibacter sp. RS28]|uniref:Outer membrane protein transport protein n=1 Tax=Mucilaginibacter straminoryzae TaxID=2932774 RepID=A0A9X1X2G4_9SPHI|nr:outer membrane protein transport protein [Mucilaginibacter straminoryzae]MCJ8209105.1 outer membrane protein transport protein [Mucilaginibacter straminoryzae]
MRRLLLLLLALVPAIAFAQGFQVNLGGQKQIGMGHTGTGLVQDGASIFFNPGAVAMLPENSIQAGISPLFFKSAFNPSGSNTVYHNANKVATPFNAYAVWGPKNGFWKFGLGVYTPFGGLTDWGNSWSGKYVLESLNLKAIYVQPTISIRLANWVSIGGGFVYNHGSVDLTRAIPVSGADGQDGQAQLKGGGNGYGWNAGVFFKATGFTAGVSYRSKVKTTIDGGDAFFTVPASLQANFPQPNTFTASIPLPSTTSVGFGIYPTNKLTLALDVNYVHWSVYKVLAFDYAKNTSTLQDTYSPRNYKDAASFRVGGQYKTTDKLALRVGGGYALTSVRDGYVTPEAPDANRYYFTAGAGYKLSRHFDIDASFEFEKVLSRNQTNIESNLSGTFNTQVYIPGVALTYHW